MENVPQVHADANKADFDNWCNFLKSKGYINHWQDLNAKDYGIPQNRERCFMVSILSKDFIDFEFPEKIKLQKVMRDFLEESVDEKYYIKNEKAQKLIKDLIANGTLRTEQNRTEQNRLSLTIDLTSRGSKQLSVVPCITSRYDAGICKHKLERGGVLELSQN
jgi:DNA (cytosine-5)-methyltransferase 1